MLIFTPISLIILICIKYFLYILIKIKVPLNLAALKQQLSPKA